MNLQYTITIQWSEADQSYLVLLPELHGEGRYATHGATYEEALKNGLEVMESLVDMLKGLGKTIPEPVFAEY